MLIRRPFAFYVASQASYFVNTFYVWLVLNASSGWSPCVATGRLVWRLADERAGLIAAALTAVGPGFVAFFATPAMYMPYYTAVVVAFCLFEELVVAEPRRGAGQVALFTGVLTLCALTYDLGPCSGRPARLRHRPLGACAAAGPLARLALRGLRWPSPAWSRGARDHDQPAELGADLRRVDGFKHEVLHPALAHWYDHVVTIVAELRAPAAAGVLCRFRSSSRCSGSASCAKRPVAVLVAAVFAADFATMAFFQIAERGC